MHRIGWLIPVALGASCLKKDPLYCDENTPCTDEARPFCDLNGEYPASEGIKRTCIADPFPDGGVGEPDAAGPRSIISLATAGITTVADGAFFGIYADRDAAPDAELLRDDIGDALDELAPARAEEEAVPVA